MAKKKEHILAFRELLKTELTFLGQIAKLRDSIPHFNLLLGEDTVEAEELCAFAKRAETLLQHTSPLLTLFDAPGQAPEQAIDEANFEEKVRKLHGIILGTESHAFLEWFSLLAIMTLRYQMLLNLIKDARDKIKRNMANPAHYPAAAQTFFGKTDPVQFLESVAIQPTQRQARYASLLETLYQKTTSGGLKGSRKLLKQASQRTAALLTSNESFQTTSDPTLVTPFLRKTFQQHHGEPLSPPLFRSLSRRRLPAVALPSDSETEVNHEPDISSARAELLELIANLMRLNDYYSGTELGFIIAHENDVPPNHKFGWRKEADELGTCAATYYHRLSRQALTDIQVVKLKTALLTHMLRVSADIREQRFRGGPNSRFGKTVKELYDYYNHASGNERPAYNPKQRLPATLFLFTPSRPVNKKGVALAEKYIQDHIIIRLARPFMAYQETIENSFWRKIFATAPEKRKAAHQIVGPKGKLTTLRETPLAERPGPAEGGLYKVLSQVINDPIKTVVGTKSAFFKGQYGVAHREATAYLDTVNPERPQQPGKSTR